MKTRFLKPILIASAFAILGPVSAQNMPKQFTESALTSNSGSFFINLKDQKLQQNTIEQRFNQMLGLADGNEFKKINEKKDDLGFTHSSYQQYYKGIPVESCMILMHLKNGVATSINGNVAKITGFQIQKGLSDTEAINGAQRDLQVNVLLHNYPATLVIVNNPYGDASNPYTTAYKVRIDGKKS